MGKILGIDLGTTNSVMSVMDKNGPLIVPNNLGDRITSSVVGFTKSGDVLVGKKARRGAVMNVGRTIFSIKRHMGTSHRVNIDGREYTPQEISGMILQKLKADAEDYFGEPINEAIVTVPAYFTDAQRAATRDAGEIAGFEVRRIIDEPSAAALAYGLDKGKDQKLLVYDLGGGTFDISIIEVVSGVFQVLAIQGDNRLGGDDFDQRIIKYLIDHFKESHSIDLTDDPIAMQRLKDAAEEAKIELSELKETHILVEAIAMTEKGPLTLDTTLTRAKFEELIDDLLQKTSPPLERAMEIAKVVPDDIDTILLVGGSTRIPAVQNLVKSKLKATPHRDMSPEEVVAMGAAVQTLVLSPQDEGPESEDLATRYGKEKPVIIHMTPFSLGVGLEKDQYAIIIERNSTYPTEAKDIFTTTRDFQEAITFPIYEGEDLKASENTFLDILRIEGITPAPKGVPRIEVTFRINADRILEAKGEDIATGVEKRITVQATDKRLSDDEKQRMISESQSRMRENLKSRAANAAEEEAEQLLTRANSILKDAPANDRTKELREMSNVLRDMISNNASSAELDDAMDNLMRIITDVEAGA
jgi:molecular chaperone DnaK